MTDFLQFLGILVLVAGGLLVLVAVVGSIVASYQNEKAIEELRAEIATLRRKR